MADPTLIAQEGYDLGVYLKDTTSGSEAFLARVQRFEPAQTFRTQKYYQIGSKGPTGVTQDPPEWSLSLERNMSDASVDFLLGGQNPYPAGAAQVKIGAMLGRDYAAALIGRTPAGTIDREIAITTLRLAEVQYRFSIRDTISEMYRFDATVGKWWTSTFPHGNSWGSIETTSPGGIHGKEARIWFTSGSVATTRVFRLQNFSIRATIPVEQVKELGRRDIVGPIQQVPDVSIDFDTLAADFQPLDKLFQTFATGYDLQTPSAYFNAFVRVFDPDSAEGTNPLKMFKIDNCRVTTNTPNRAQARGTGTGRFALTSAKEVVADSGGLTISNRNDLT